MTYPPPNVPPYGAQPPSMPPYGAQPPAKKRNKVLWIVLGAGGVLLLCCGGFGFFVWKMTLSPDSGPQQIQAVIKDYKQAEDAGDASKLAGLLCKEDAPDAAQILRNDAVVAKGEVTVKSSKVVNSLGMVAFEDTKGTRWTLFFRKEGDAWKACPSAQEAYKAADKN